MKENKVYIHLNKVYEQPNNTGAFKYYELCYRFELGKDQNNNQYYTEEWKDKVLTPISGEKIPTYLWEGDYMAKSITIDLKVLSSTNRDKIPKNGIIRITEVPDRAKDSLYRIAMRLVSNGGPIEGNGTIIHYGDGD